MKKLCFFLFAFISFSSSHAAAQNLPAGDTCNNPINVQLCDSNGFTIIAENYFHSGEVGSWNVNGKRIYANGEETYYQITLPSSSYQPVSLNAIFNGYFSGTYYSPCEVYFLWFENSPCTSQPVGIDSLFIVAVSQNQPDLDTITYNVNLKQSTYYLVIVFRYFAEYSYTINLGFINNQPANVGCSPGLPPFKGKLELDTSKCYTIANPCHLPFASIGSDSNSYHILLPDTLNNQSLKYIPVNDQNGMGFVLTTDDHDPYGEQVIESFDRFPFTYVPANEYTFAFTVLMKNNGGASGLKGFKIQVPPGNYTYRTYDYLLQGSEIPKDSAAGTYNTTGTWKTTFTPDNTCTWLFNSPDGRGDNTNNSGYSCQVYTFSVTANYNLQGLVYAWYLPDDYGSDTLSCPRSDCSVLDQQQWIPLIGTGNGIEGITCYDGDTLCPAGVAVLECTNGGYEDDYDQWAYNLGCVSHNEYYNNGCYRSFTGVWDTLYPAYRMPAASNQYPYYFQIFDTICAGGSYTLNLIAGNGNLSTLLLYNYGYQYNNNYPVDANGGIDSSSPHFFDYDPLQTPYNNPSYENISTYHLTQAGEYNLAYFVEVGDGFGNNNNAKYYAGEDCIELELYVRPNVNITIKASADSMFYCNFYNNYTNSVTLTASGSPGYEWFQQYDSDTLSDSAVITVSPYYTTTYYVVAPPLSGCIDTAFWVVKVSDRCPPALDSNTINLKYATICYGTCYNPGGSYSSSEYDSWSWQWKFAGGNPSSYNSGFLYGAVCYDSAGVFPAQVIATNQYGSDTLNWFVTVQKCLPQVSFGATDTPVCRTGCINFGIYSSGIPANWYWNFPGGNPSTYNGESPPKICYDTAGTYTAQLIASNSYGADTLVETLRVIDCLPPVASFIAPDTVCTAGCISVSNTSTNANEWQWTLTNSGNPTHSFSQNISQYCYYIPGTYTIQLIAGNGFTSDTTVKAITVINCPKPVASFTTADTICAMNCVTVTNTSANATTWQWNFEGGNPSSYYGQTPPQVCYGTPGNYSVQLIAGNSYGYDTVSKNITINNCAGPTASFSAADTICATNCVTVTNISANATTWQWSFVGGNLSSYIGQSPPQICYNDTGTYQIQLIAGNNYGSDTTVEIITVQDCGPDALFSATQTAICPGDCVNFNNLSSVNSTSWQWSFTGGTPSLFNGRNPSAICYDTAGSFDVTLIASNAYGSDTLYKPGYITVTNLPQPHITQNNDTLKCTLAITYQWYNSNQIISGATDQWYVPLQDGEYSVSVTDNSGCGGADSIEYIATGISNTTDENDFIISPNPNGGLFQVASFTLQVEEIEVYNVLGERILVSGIKTEDIRPITIDLSSQADGIYFVRVQTENGTVMKKVVKN